MSASEEINAKLDWCVAALRYLLQEKAGGVLPEDEDAWLDDADWEPEATVADYLAAETPDPNEHVAVRTRRQPKAKACPHNQQGIVDGVLRCLRCGFGFTQTGSVQNRVSQTGAVIQDPNPPGWALEHSPGASSKNPGTPLVPHSD